MKEMENRGLCFRMKKSCLGFFIVICSQSCFSQISNEVVELSKKLDTIYYAESSHIGIGGESSRVFSLFTPINLKATNYELYHFAINGSNSLRLYSSQSLVDRKDIKKIEYLYRFYLRYPIKISYQDGCVVELLNIIEVIRNRLDYIIQIIDSDIENKLKQREYALRDRIVNYKLSKEELDFCNKTIKELIGWQLYYSRLRLWSKNEIQNVILRLNELDETFKSQGFIDLK